MKVEVFAPVLPYERFLPFSSGHTKFCRFPEDLPVRNSLWQPVLSEPPGRSHRWRKECVRPVRSQTRADVVPTIEHAVPLLPKQKLTVPDTCSGKWYPWYRVRLRKGCPAEVRNCFAEWSAGGYLSLLL